MPSARTHRVVAARRWLWLGWVQISMSTAVVRPRRGWLGPARKRPLLNRLGGIRPAGTGQPAAAGEEGRLMASEDDLWRLVVGGRQGVLATVARDGRPQLSNVL
jgi:hypothetical protein